MSTMTDGKHLTTSELEAGLEAIRQAPQEEGVLHLIVRRPQSGEREVVTEAELDPVEGLVGDNWRARGSRDPEGPDPATQLNIMNSRVIALVAQTKERWQLAGDQLFIDFDLSAENVPPGTQLSLGSAVIEVSDEPHTGCGKFIKRFGVDAAKFVNGRVGRQLQLRGINARVIRGGVVRVGDVVRKV
jgi:MOSC domain-containing protein YiiM